MKIQIQTAGGKLVASAAAAIALLTFTGCTTDHPQGSQNTAIAGDDHAIVWQVQDGFRTSPVYPYAGVRVAATNGDVQLTGYVETLWQKYDAAAIAARVPGVKAVHNQLIAWKDNGPTTAASGAQE